MADPHIQMGEVLKEAREKTEGPAWSYPARENGLTDAVRKSLADCTAGPPAWARPDSGPSIVRSGNKMIPTEIAQSYETHTGYFPSPSCTCAVCDALRSGVPEIDAVGYERQIAGPGDLIKTLYSHSHDATFNDFTPPEDMEQGYLAPALRVVHGYLIYVAVFAAGWFLSAVYSLGVVKGWW